MQIEVAGQECCRVGLAGRIAADAVRRLPFYRVPRGLPRLVWVTRHLLFGKGTKLVPYGRRFVIYCDTDSYHHMMFAYGIEDRLIDRLLAMVLTPGAVMLDVGANVGMISLLASSLPAVGSTVSVHAFEPDPRAFYWLKRNVSLNRGFNLSISNCAVGADTGKRKLVMSTVLGWSTLAPEPEGGFDFLTSAGEVTVPVVTLDDYCLSHQLHPSLIKLDIEGFEVQALRGASRLLANERPLVIFEVNPGRLAAAGSSPAELAALFDSFRYHVVSVDDAVRRDSLLRRWHATGGPSALLGVRAGSALDFVGVPDDL